MEPFSPVNYAFFSIFFAGFGQTAVAHVLQVTRRPRNAAEPSDFGRGSLTAFKSQQL